MRINNCTLMDPPFSGTRIPELLFLALTRVARSNAFLSAVGVSSMDNPPAPGFTVCISVELGFELRSVSGWVGVMINSGARDHFGDK